MSVYEYISQLTGLVIYQIRLIWPYWLIGVAIGALLSETVGGEAVTRLMSRLDHGTPSRAALIFAGALFGASSPLCLYGAIPILGALYACGIPMSSIVAFLISSPLINPNLFIFSFALGAPLALARLACAVLLGTIAGLLVEFTRARRLLLGIRFPDHDHMDPDHTHMGHAAKEQSASGRISPKRLMMSALSSAGFMGKYMLLGTLLAAIVHLSFPRVFLLRTLGPENPFAVLVAASLGIPLYVCGGGTIPLVRDLLWLGMSPGAALAFLLSGPTTKMTNLTALGAILGKRNLAFYVAFNLIGAVVLGYLYSLLPL